MPNFSSVYPKIKPLFAVRTGVKLVSVEYEYTESFEINQLLDYEQPTAYIVANDEYSTDTSLTPCSKLRIKVLSWGIQTKNLAYIKKESV